MLADETRDGSQLGKFMDDLDRIGAHDLNIVDEIDPMELSRRRLILAAEKAIASLKSDACNATRVVQSPSDQEDRRPFKVITVMWEYWIGGELKMEEIDFGGRGT